MKKINLILLLSLFLFFKSSFSQYGIIDSTFNGIGMVMTDISTKNDGMYAIAIQPDGKIVAAGNSVSLTIQNASYISLARFNPNGSLDMTFGTGGKVIFMTPGEATQSTPARIALQPDGKIVVSGQTYNITKDEGRIIVIRLNSDGTPDNTFDSDGLVIANTALPGYDCYATSLALQADGKILITGFPGYQNGFLAVRFNTNGSLDNTFDSDGIVMIPVSSTYDRSKAIAIQTDGKIVVGGYSNTGTKQDFALIRLNANGSLDNSFDTDGKVTTSLGPTRDQAYAMVIQPDGKTILGGLTIQSNSNNDFSLARFNTDGSLDNSFGTSGRTTINGLGNDMIRSIALQTDGKILFVGLSQNSGLSPFCLMRLYSNGTVDTTFGTKGIATTLIGGANADAFDVVTLPDNKIMVGGFGTGITGGDFALARFTSGLKAGIIDFSISKNSVLVYPNPISERTTLEYTLSKDEEIKIELVDINGRNLITYLHSSTQSSGVHHENIVLPETLPSGYYFIVISGKEGSLSIKIVK